MVSGKYDNPGCDLGGGGEGGGGEGGGGEGGGEGREGDSHIKVMGMLFLLLRGTICRFWSHLGYPGGKLNIFTYPLVL